ncbi:diguanylate cyclase [Acanthopleuribacter pedis]|uniref:diguanylate cyclase n=1 Tax=Acanthopleuribacter pedis TaxID=442870 RepID=A0A8J7U690_9BACT|nr:diguanylate cyclase [Acanthopleuribacter pedis]MBO1323358.1 diguanylate cyclase [Acanthopleuribacter pedis]
MANDAPSFVLRWTANGETTDFVLSGESYNIGRDPSLDICIDDGSVSRHHARCVRKDDTYYLVDLGSSNGTKINGALLESHQPCALEPDDDVLLGRRPMRYLTLAKAEATESEESETAATQRFTVNFSSLRWNQELSRIRHELGNLVEAQVEDADKAALLKNSMEDELRGLHQFVEAKFREHEVLQQINQEIGKILDTNQLLSTALRMVVDVLGADRGFILLYDATHGVLRSMVTHRFDRVDHSALDFDFTFSQTIAKTCFENQRIEFIDDAMQDHRFKSSQSIMASRIRSVVCIPLKQEDKTSGVIYLDNLNEVGTFHRHQTEFLTAFSCQTAIALENARLYTQAVTDDLSRLYNRKYIDKRVYEEMRRARRYDRDCSLILLDIDHFKKVNDTYGHLIGDQVIVGVSNVLRETTRATDIAARYGGEEFMVLLPETDMAGCRLFAERLRKAVEDLTTEKNGLKLKVTVSLGVACYRPWMENNVSGFIDQADKALYEAKKQGRNRVISAEELPGEETSEAE